MLTWIAENPALVTVAVPILALAGVVWSTLRSGKNMINAETARHENALAAMERQAAAAIAAENRRAELDREAEDRRHERALQVDQDVWVRGAKTKAYFAALNALARYDQATIQMLWFSRPPESADDPTNASHVNSDGVRRAVEEANAAIPAIDFAVAEIRAVGASHIVALVDKAKNAMYERSQMVELRTWEEWQQQKGARSRLSKKVRKRMRAVVNAIRAEFNVDPEPTGAVEDLGR